MRRFRILLFFVIFFQLLIHSDTITVVNTSDSGAGSLRQAVLDASAGDMINFSITGTITLTSEIAFNKNLTISGPGISQLSINGGDSTRIFNTSGTVIISGLTITNGRADDGGGILLTSGSLSISNCTFSYCTATDDGGGLYQNDNTTILTVTNSTFNNNHSIDRGGALYIRKATLEKCTIHNNLADDDGGALDCRESSFINCTIYKNTAVDDGGAFYAYIGGTSYITNCTIVDNSCGDITNSEGIFVSKLSPGAVFYIKNTIIANNKAGSADKDVLDRYGDDIISGGNNVVEVYSTITGLGGSENRFESNGDIYGDQVNLWGTGIAATPSLADNFANNQTQTIKLVAGSVAIDAGNAAINGTVTVPSNDQREFARVNTLDIGAFEFQHPSNSLSPTGIQNIYPGADGSILTVTENPSAYTFTRLWKYAAASGGPYNSIPGQINTTYSPNFHSIGTYYVICESTCSGTVYTSNEVQINVMPRVVLPTVTTNTVAGTTGASVLIGGNVISDGGAAVTTRGVCWSTSPSPVITGNHTSDATGTGSFASLITGLDPVTLYYIRAYATNSTGTSYGNEVSCTTTAAAPTLTTIAVTGATSTSASSGGNVTSDGGGSVTARGVCWSTSPYPSLSDSHTNDGAGKGNFVSSLSGLIPDTVYYVRAYAENLGGRAFGKTVTFATLESFPEIEITEPLEGAIVNGVIGIRAEATAPGNPVEFYIDDVLLGNGIANRSKNSISGIILNKIDVVFDINNSEYLFIDSENILKKILTDGNIENVFDKDIVVEDIRVNSIGEVYIRLGTGITLYGYDNARDIMIDVVNKTVSGINKTDFEIKKEHVLIEFNKYIDSYSLFSDHRNPAERKTIAFLKKRPVKVIKNIVSSPFNVQTRTGFRFRYSERNDDIKTDISYTIHWDTMNHSDGLHKIKVLAYDRYSRSFSDEIEVFIRKLKIVLNAIRKEDMALTFRINSAELTFKVENPEELPVAKYIVYRSVAGGEFVPISEIDPLTVIDNQYKCYDARISLEKIYSYKVIAYDSSGNILSESEIRSI